MASPRMPNPVLSTLRILPRSSLSRLAGRAAAIRLPRALRAPAWRLFGRITGIDFAEVGDPLDSFACLQDFFTRRLRDGARPIDPAPDALVAPCDGAWGEAGAISGGMLLQVKGRPYSLARLLGNDADAAALEGGSFATFYLSPRDYHRFHAPCAVQVRAARHIPGTLWPVNRIGIEGIDALFAENERICALFTTTHSAPLWIVAVGATLVGKIRVTFDDLTTNVRGAGRTERRYADSGTRYVAGAEWGRFEFGSTLVLLLPPGSADLEIQRLGTPLRLGSHIGRLRPAALPFCA